MSLVLMTWGILFCSVIDYTSADAIQLILVNNASCSLVIDYLNEFDSCQLNWEGDVLPPNCQLRFNAKSIIASERRDKYKVCVETFEYHITKCNLKMKYYSEGKHGTIQEHSSGTSQQHKFCAAEGDTLLIGLSSTVPSDSSFQLMVTAVKTYTHEEKNLYLVYIVVASLSLLCIMISCIIILVVCKKQKQAQHSRTGSQTTTPYNASMVQGAFPSDGIYNQGYVNTEKDLYQHEITIRPPEYSEKEDKTNPPPYTTVSEHATLS
ncbi:uncharacterized protein LOC117330525 [Pecten maximus]|uniref:uncharacterized protein LOC117330525 n=1 Tax=Pecten maximus TaxID=6579 RepID=UPI001458B11D|nr:uncharacterized protein LOC117330525 [Pecten maximus]